MSGLNALYNNAAFALHLHSAAMAVLQEQASTGSRINRPSDEPTAAGRLLGLSSQQRYLKAYMTSIDSAVSTHEMASTILQQMSSALSDSMVNLTQIVSGTYGQGQGGQNARDRAAAEINDILEQMVALANTKHVDQYIFGGNNTADIPYIVQRSGGEITAVDYCGSSENRSIEAAPGVFSLISFAGENLFSADSRSTPVFYGSTGAAAGTGTSNVRGQVWLTVTFDGSSYFLSIDDGATRIEVPSEGDVSNIAVTDAAGRVLYVDASNLKAAGVEKVTVPGTENLFNALISVRDLLRNPRGFSDTMLADLIKQSSDLLESVKNNLVEKETRIGARLNFLSSLKENLDNLQFNEEQEASLLQEADIAQIAIDLSRRENLYQMSLLVSGKLMSMSLLDFLK